VNEGNPSVHILSSRYHGRGRTSSHLSHSLCSHSAHCLRARCCSDASCRNGASTVIRAAFHTRGKLTRLVCILPQTLLAAYLTRYCIMIVHRYFVYCP